jgi:outer membrane biosynthesis protein TonB
MTATGARPPDALPPESKAMLSLVLVQRRSYQEIAEMLHMAPADVRKRAHTAAELLVGGPDQMPSPAARARIIDYLLGEQTVSERELTRSELTSLGASRAWAKRLAASLAPLAKEPLPSIPAPEPAPPEPTEPVEPAAPPERTPPRVAPPPVAPPPAFISARSEPPRQAAPPTSEEPPSGPRRGLIAAIVVAVVVAVAVAVIVAVTSGGSPTPAGVSTPATSVPATGTTPVETRGGKTVRRLVLVGTASSNRAFGSGAVISQRGKLLLLLQARGLAPNHHNLYGVWLYNGTGDARLLGFVSPPVGADGRFSSSVSLPNNAAHFHSLLVTLEPNDLPKSPGPTVLRSPLSLP